MSSQIKLYYCGMGACVLIVTKMSCHAVNVVLASSSSVVMFSSSSDVAVLCRCCRQSLSTVFSFSRALIVAVAGVVTFSAKFCSQSTPNAKRFSAETILQITRFRNSAFRRIHHPCRDITGVTSHSSDHIIHALVTNSHDKC